MKLFVIISVFASAGLVLMSPVSQATTLRRQSLEQLAERADCVVRGHIVRQETERRKNLLYTVNSFVVDEVLRSDPDLQKSVASGKRLHVSQLGGQLGSWQMHVAGTAPLQVGDSQVLFLQIDPQRPGYFYIAGMSQGALKVVAEKKLLWAPTAALWTAGRVDSPSARWLDLAELRKILGVRR